MWLNTCNTALLFVPVYFLNPTKHWNTSLNAGLHIKASSYYNLDNFLNEVKHCDHIKNHAVSSVDNTINDDITIFSQLIVFFLVSLMTLVDDIVSLCD